MQTVTLRSGVVLPDRSVIHTDTGHAVLDALFGRPDMNIVARYGGLDKTEDQVWRAILNHYGHSGKAPTGVQIADAVGINPEEIANLLHRLVERDLVVLDESNRVVVAYPFTEWTTEHQVRVGANLVAAMCAIDALGIGVMLGLDTTIRSACRHCGRKISVTTRDQGTSINSISPDATLVWSGTHYANSCAATSACTVQAFFCSSDHLKEWRLTDRAGEGFLLSVEEAFQVARAFFEPMLISTEKPGLLPGNGQ